MFLVDGGSGMKLLSPQSALDVHKPTVHNCF